MERIEDPESGLNNCCTFRIPWPYGLGPGQHLDPGYSCSSGLASSMCIVAGMMAVRVRTEAGYE
jgi:hypothetical protein